MKNDLIDRYVYAATRYLGKKTKEDVSRELYGLIDDMLTERCGETPPSEKDIRVVLTELGSPRELYARYSGEEEKCLIGQPCYSTYCLLLKVVLGCVALGMTVSAGILAVTEELLWYEAVGEWLGLLWNGLLSGFAILTILFAVLYRKGIHLSDPFDFDSLPPVPKKKAEIQVGESVFGIVISLAFLVVFLIAPQIIRGKLPETGEWFPVFNVEAIRESWYIFVLFFLAGIFREVVKLIQRRYDRRVLATTLLCDGVSAGLAIWWLSGREIMSSGWEKFVRQVFAEESAELMALFLNFRHFFLGVFLLALALDAATTIFRTEKV